MLELDLLKFCAIVLITNSHLDHLYPNPNFAFGGSLGNSIFFFVSGIGLTISLSSKSRGFLTWFRKRFLRTYPIMWVATLIFLGLGVLRVSPPWWHGMIVNFIYPTPYWFIPAITLFYIPVYFVIRLCSRVLTLVFISLVLIGYLLIYFLVIDYSRPTVEEDGYFKWVFYFLVMLVGVFIGKWNREQNARLWVRLLMLAVFTTIYLGFKYTLARYPGFMPYQFLAQLVVIPWVYYLFSVMQVAVNIKSKFGVPYIRDAVVFVSALTLEIYLLQYYIFHLSFVTRHPFPFNLILFVSICLVLSWILHIVYKYSLKVISANK